eukprot:Nk52_evm11s564 gene=Nk52_evmTU11s564
MPYSSNIFFLFFFIFSSVCYTHGVPLSTQSTSQLKVETDKLPGIVKTPRDLHDIEVIDKYVDEFLHLLRALTDLSTPVSAVQQLTTVDGIQHTQCTSSERVNGVCKPGQVVIDGFQTAALLTQRKVGISMPLNQQTFFGTHNSFASIANGWNRPAFEDVLKHFEEVDNFLINLVIRLALNGGQCLPDSYSIDGKTSANCGFTELAVNILYLAVELSKYHGDLNPDLPRNQALVSFLNSQANGRAYQASVAKSGGMNLSLSFILFFANQVFDIKDQLAMGVRFFDLMPTLVTGDKLILCHTSSSFGTGFCQKASTQTFEEVLKDIADFQTNSEDFEPVIVKVQIKGNFQVPENKLPLVRNALTTAFRDSLLVSEQDWNETTKGRWPTGLELMQMNKSVIAFGDVSANATDGSLWFNDNHLTPGWPKNNMNEVLFSYPNCPDYVRNPDLRWGLLGGEAEVIGDLSNGEAEHGVLTAKNMTNLLACGITVPEMDDVCPILMRSAIWTWQEDVTTENIELVNRGKLDADKCVILNSESQRWEVSSTCGDIQFACSKDGLVWEFEDSPCSSQYKLGCPFNAYSQMHLVGHLEAATLSKIRLTI